MTAIFYLGLLISWIGMVLFVAGIYQYFGSAAALIAAGIFLFGIGYRIQRKISEKLSHG